MQRGTPYKKSREKPLCIYTYVYIYYFCYQPTTLQHLIFSQSWEKAEGVKASFTSDITPLILAAHKDNYEILRILLDRGATLPTPHDVKCACDDCIVSSEEDSLRWAYTSWPVKRTVLGGRTHRGQ